MERITDDLVLLPLKSKDQEKLFTLMKQIYPPVYKHLWYDNGLSYLNSLYSKTNFEKEINDPLSNYYFIVYQGAVVGILRILINERHYEIKNANCIKLQRIYLAPSTHGRGLGRKVMEWIEKQFSSDKETTLWLEAMETQKGALSFYDKMGFKLINHFKFDSESMREPYRGMVTLAKNISKR